MRWEPHVRFGERSGETDQRGRWHRVPVRLHQLPKLQRFSTGAGSSEDRFLYDYGWPDEVLASRVRSAGFDSV